MTWESSIYALEKQLPQDWNPVDLERYHARVLTVLRPYSAARNQYRQKKGKFRQFFKMMDEEINYIAAYANSPDWP